MSSRKRGMRLKITGRVTITNMTTGKVLVDEENDIHSQNMARIVARRLANEDNSHIFRIAYGDEGSHVPFGTTVLKPSNAGDQATGWGTRLYHEVYSEVIDTNHADFGTDLGSAGSDNTRIGGGEYVDEGPQALLGTGDMGGDPDNLGVVSEEIGTKSKITIVSYINENEPTAINPFTFDELGLYSTGLKALDTSGYSTVAVGDTDLGIRLGSTSDDPLINLLVDTEYAIQISVDGTLRTGIIKTPTGGGSHPMAYFTYGDLCEGINTSTWFFSGENFAEYVILSIGDTSGTYPSLIGKETYGYLAVHSLTTGAASTIAITPDTFISGTRNLFELMVTPDQDKINDTSEVGALGGIKNDAVNQTNEGERLLTHLIFPPVDKEIGEMLRVLYTITVGVGEDAASVSDIPPGFQPPVTQSLTPEPTSTPEETPLSTLTPTPTLTPSTTPAITPTLTVTPSLVGQVNLTTGVTRIIESQPQNTPFYRITFQSDGTILEESNEPTDSSSGLPFPITTLDEWWSIGSPVIGIGNDYYVVLLTQSIVITGGTPGFVYQVNGAGIGVQQIMSSDRMWTFSTLFAEADIGNIAMVFEIYDVATDTLQDTLTLSTTINTLIGAVTATPTATPVATPPGTPPNTPPITPTRTPSPSVTPSNSPPPASPAAPFVRLNPKSYNSFPYLNIIRSSPVDPWINFIFYNDGGFKIFTNSGQVYNGYGDFANGLQWWSTAPSGGIGSNYYLNWDYLGVPPTPDIAHYQGVGQSVDVNLGAHQNVGWRMTTDSPNTKLAWIVFRIYDVATDSLQDAADFIFRMEVT